MAEELNTILDEAFNSMEDLAKAIDTAGTAFDVDEAISLYINRCSSSSLYYSMLKSIFYDLFLELNNICIGEMKQRLGKAENIDKSEARQTFKNKKRKSTIKTRKSIKKRKIKNN